MFSFVKTEIHNKIKQPRNLRTKQTIEECGFKQQLSIDSADQKEACKACAQLIPFGLMLEYFLAIEKTPEKWETLLFCS